MRKLHKSNREKIFSGVCGGIAEFVGISPTIVRTIFILSLLFGGAGVWAYLIFMVILPKRDEQIIDAEIVVDEIEYDETGKPFQKIRRSNKDSIIAGVCGGLSDYLKWDASIIRIAFVAMSFAGGIGFALYLIFWLMFPLEEV